MRTRKVKILATLGPTSSDRDTIRRLFEAGADLFRINMSHADHDLMRRLVTTIRSVETEEGRPIGILVDLQGPKLRLGLFANGMVDLNAGDTFVLDSDPAPGDETRVGLPHPEILSALEPGHRLLLDDGKVHLVTTECAPDRAVTRVVAGTHLSDRKGVSVPDTTIGGGALTEKDRSDLEAALNAEIDWVALSFIQRPEDLADIHELVRGRAGVLAKIEKPQAVDRLTEIIEASDALMVARGDLGVEMPLELVPGIQKRITRACRAAGKPVVIATQMLDSMITSPVPTRAEVSDVATAVFEGADAIMLSGESAAGKYPIESVATMNRIAKEVERDPNYDDIMRAQRTAPDATAADAISAASRQMADTLHLSAICCYTASGTTAQRAARERPSTPVLALSPVVATARRLSLVWGLHCVFGEEPGDLNGMVRRAGDVVQDEGFARVGDRIIITAGIPFGTPGATNLIRIAFVEGPARPPRQTPE